MANNLKMAHQEQIQALIRLGWSDRRISREMPISRTTAGRYRRTFQNVPHVPTDSVGAESRPIVPTDSGPPLPASKSQGIDPFRDIIRRKYEEGLSAQRIYQDLIEDGTYKGSYYSVKRYSRKLRLLVSAKGYARLPMRPGGEAQVDFAKGALVLRDGKYSRSWLFKMTLSYSGHAYEELVFSQNIETFLRCHEHAFEFFGGVPATIKLDNLKSGVLLASLYDPVLNPQYKAFSEHWGFVPNPCPPNTPNQKGRVERDVGYTKDNALKGRKFNSLLEGNAFLRSWNERWARTRIHGSKKRQVWALFTESEREALRSLASKPYIMFKMGRRRVSWYGYIEVGGNYYRLPEAHIGEWVQVHANQESIRVYRNQVLIRILRPMQGRGHVDDSVKGDRPERPAFLAEREGMLAGEARTIGPDCHALVLRILDSEADPIAFRRVMGIVRLVRKYPKEVVNFSCQWALSSGRHYYPEIMEACANIVATGVAEAPPYRLLQEHELIRQPSEYSRLLQERNHHGEIAVCSEIA